MKTNYCQAWINSQTGDIEHMAVSDAPLVRDHIEPVIPDPIPLNVPGQPDPPPLTYKMERFEVQVGVDPDDPKEGRLFRAKEMMQELEVRGGRPELKAGRQGQDRLEIRNRVSRGVFSREPQN